MLYAETGNLHSSLYVPCQKLHPHSGLILHQAFCEEHLAVALEAEYPTKVTEFIRFCGANSINIIIMHTLDEGVDDLSAYVNIHQNQIEKLNDI